MMGSDERDVVSEAIQMLVRETAHLGRDAKMVRHAIELLLLHQRSERLMLQSDLANRTAWAASWEHEAKDGK